MGVLDARTQDRPTAGGHPTVRHAVETMLLEERTRWAMQVHDGLTQSVTSAVLELQTLRHRIETDPGVAVATLREVEDELREDLRRIREMLFEMTTSSPGQAQPALVALVRDAMDRWHMQATIEVAGDLDGADEEVLEAAYAIVAEGLANAAKHSGVAAAAVRVRGGGRRAPRRDRRPRPRHRRGRRRRSPFRPADHADPRRGPRRDVAGEVDPRTRHHRDRRAPRRRTR